MLQKQLQLPVPILQSTYLIFKSCEELCALVKCLPPYADDFCQAIIDLLFKHRESCNKLFLSIVERNDSPGTSIYSNEWVKDPDINRHLRTMPAFDAFIRMARQQQQQSTNNNRQDDNADTMRFRQAKETETLLINFSRDEMNLDDICTNYKHVKLLANIHESLDWLYNHLSYYFDILDKCLSDPKHLDALTQTTGRRDRTKPYQSLTDCDALLPSSDTWLYISIIGTESASVRSIEIISRQPGDLLQCHENNADLILRYSTRFIS